MASPRIQHHYALHTMLPTKVLQVACPSPLTYSVCLPPSLTRIAASRIQVAEFRLDSEKAAGAPPATPHVLRSHHVATGF
ncbi:hypothetical protein B0T26DRAFT_711981 [Lasiosphaeria miniovina]|uniref:Uncharacterized protein n=1 Tax=Lasiosphaeria miniovina TaxID=1954250 RepID=A0AA40DZ08_9PEZI|nr:uncharacterized protein B0T26DRAFT_711981 [Lasiosphaeria miniovina]KAK0718131.1 hypothetical protein B0T26DRAFT_711981 [Lasiosphaeria miniovina]